MGDVLNILAAADSAEAADKSLFQSLSCRWSRNPNKNKENEGFNVCDDKGRIFVPTKITLLDSFFNVITLGFFWKLGSEV